MKRMKLVEIVAGRAAVLLLTFSQPGVGFKEWGFRVAGLVRFNACVFIQLVSLRQGVKIDKKFPLKKSCTGTRLHSTHVCQHFGGFLGLFSFNFWKSTNVWSPSSSPNISEHWS